MLETLKQCWQLTPVAVHRRWRVLMLANVTLGLLEAAAALGLVLLLGIMTGTALGSLPGGRYLVAALEGYSENGRILAMCAGLGVLFAAKAVLGIVVMRLQNRIPLEAGNLLAERLFGLYVRGPYSFHLQRNTAETLRNLGAAVDAVFRVVGMSALTIATEVFSAGALLALMFAASARESLIVLALSIAAMLASYKLVNTRIAAWGARVQALSKDGMIRARDALEGIKEVRLTGTEDHFIRRYASVRQELTRALASQADLQQLPRFVLEAFFIFVIIALVAVLSTRGDRSEVLPILGLYAYAGLRLMPSVSRVLGAMNAIRYASAPTALVHEDVNRLDGLAGQGTHAVSLELKQGLRLDAVSFRYDGASADAVQGASIEICKGQLVAIVGASGAGKSTLVDLLLGLHAPQRGRVLVDGCDIAGAIGAWQAAIGYVAQSVFVLDESLRRNVAFGVGDAEIDDARVMEAIGRAQLDDAVAGLPEGLATRLGERGSRLSGGQRQRVGIARALYAGRKVLVLDEAMSAVDTLTERELNDTIERLRGEHTIILITHRMQLVSQCDVVVMMGRGRIIASGAFNDVYVGSAEFRALYHAAGEAGSANGIGP